MNQTISLFQINSNTDFPFSPGDYSKFKFGDSSIGKSFGKALANKFIEMLTHPDNIETYKNQIKRMALGTMSQKEFEKIYQATKHKMIHAPKPKTSQNRFESFDEYKNES